MNNDKLSKEQSKAFKSSIRKLFSDIATKTTYAERNFLCCSTCAIAEFEARDSMKLVDDKKTGFVYYHKQDAPDIKYGSLSIRYGCFSGDEDAIMTLANHICATARSLGLIVEWNGKTSQVITVMPDLEGED